ncbi:MAG TPA: hypothetical protein VFL47_13520, partial [Flavisolibacter sp.]|nr:hypothetical protein [Flavisolibacter sp.]
MKKSMVLLLAIFLFARTYAQQDSSTPVSTAIVSFQVQPVDKVVLLKWTVDQPDEYKAFDIERSDNGIDFIKVGSKLAISKNSNADYDFVDATPKANTGLRYRLKIISLNGVESYSELKEAKVGESLVTVLLKQNPVRNSIDFAITAAGGNQASVAVFSQSGQQLAVQTFRLSTGVNQLSLSAQSLLP